MFRNILRYALTAAMLVAASQAGAIELPQKKINGRSYYYYMVQPKETIYSLCERLGLTKDEIIRYNPTVADGLRAYQTLYFPESVFTNKEADSRNTATADDNRQSGVTHGTPDTSSLPDTYTVKRGDTIYSLCKRFGITSATLLARNPDAANGIKAGMTLRIAPVGSETVTAATPAAADGVESSAADDMPATPAPDVPYKVYKVKKKETLYSIARKHHVTVADIESLNPGLAALQKDQLIYLPDGKNTTPAVKEVATAPVTLAVSNQEPAVTQPAASKVDKGIRIGVMLPFMLDEEKPGKQAQLYTDFYKGLLLAADSLRDSGKPIHIAAFDTHNSLDSVKALLRRPAMSDLAVIIAPDDDAQLAALAAFGNDNDCGIFNIFSVHNDLYTSNPSVIQANIPHSLMYGKTIERLSHELNGRIPVFLTRREGRADKEEFTKSFKQFLDAHSLPYRDIEYADYLTADDLAALSPAESYLFIPASGAQSEFTKIVNTLRKLRDDSDDPERIKLFGYPEWITFRGETLDRLHKMNATIYSRFYVDNYSFRTKDLDEKFKQWYGKGMLKAMPTQGTLGFDTGMFLIKALGQGDGLLGDDDPRRYDGVQSGFHLVRPSDDGGFVNEALYFVTFRPSGLIEKIAVR
ncbi:MAG: LysM peptidoglycan-binding domain-containing protein [Pseudoflavonifractor sp.]|nr:LysM peptidoglycan-binding domain-containing protein [Pseudoflavonifractor sp.]